MDEQRFEYLAKTLANSTSRRTAIRAIAGSAGASLFALFGLGSTTIAARRLQITKQPEVTFDGFQAIVTWVTDQPADGVVEYGTTARPDQKVLSEEVTTDHRVVLPDLEPDTRYYFRVRSTGEGGTVRSARLRFKTPNCPQGTESCGGDCVSSCPDGWRLDTETCGCVCAKGMAPCGDACIDVSQDPANCGDCGVVCELENAVADCIDGKCVIDSCAEGFGDCDGDVANGCETALGSVDHCQACGDRCDDGNACTEDACDPSTGCTTTNLEDGTACGEGGICKDGACVDCTSGGTCRRDRDCCDGEVCCDGTCVDTSQDPANCGECGNRCPSETCTVATCSDGKCDAKAVEDGEPCDDDNPCTEKDHCMGGTCMGSPIEDGEPCGDGKECSEGICVEPEEDTEEETKGVVTAAATPSVLFQDGFESGNLSLWTQTSGLVVQKTEVSAGTYGARGTSAGTRTYARKTLSAGQTELYTRIRVKRLDSGSSLVDLLLVRDTSGRALWGIYITSAGKLAAYNSVTKRSTTSATSLGTGWHTIEAHVLIAGTSSMTEVWRDGTKLGDLTVTQNLGTVAIGQFEIGDGETGRTYDVAFDDVAACVGVCPASPTGDTPASTTPPPSSGGDSTAAGGDTRRLLASYNLRTDNTPAYSLAAYRPRQFTAGLSVSDTVRGNVVVSNSGEYDRWDVLTPPNYGEERIRDNNDWLDMQLNRSATLAVVWRAGTQSIPSWLQSWTPGGTVTLSGTTMRTYKKVVPAGQVFLGGVFSPGAVSSPNRDTYWVLFAENDGLRSAPAPVPSGRETPQANQTCPAWVHDQYVATGPDGKVYTTWHNQIDPVHWCYHRHEHGSDPAHFLPTYKSVFGYSAAVHGMSEPHPGFKNIVFDNAGIRWLITIHFGTAGLARVCTRYHTVDIAARSLSTGELLADLHFMGDFGPSIVNVTKEAFVPQACPNQYAEAGSSRGVRQIPTDETGGVAYEPWRVASEGTVLGLVGTFLINNIDPMVICNTDVCDQGVSTGFSGSTRFLDGTGFGIVAGTKNSGTFYTDALGLKFLTSGASGAVQQYIKPGVNLTFALGGAKCRDVNAWGQPFVCNTTATGATPTNREGSLQAPN